MGKFRQLSTELLPLIYVEEMVSVLYLEYFLTDFLQTLYKSRYWGGVDWECRWVNFVK